jgi:hypothetical protein
VFLSLSSSRRKPIRPSKWAISLRSRQGGIHDPKWLTMPKVLATPCQLMLHYRKQRHTYSECLPKQRTMGSGCGFKARRPLWRFRPQSHRPKAAGGYPEPCQFRNVETWRRDYGFETGNRPYLRKSVRCCPDPSQFGFRPRAALRQGLASICVLPRKEASTRGNLRKAGASCVCVSTGRSRSIPSDPWLRQLWRASG